MENAQKGGIRERMRAHHDVHMARLAGRRRIGPQAVPRGFLPMYILSVVARQPETGYSLTQHINERTRGAWRPGPGTIYPMLKTMKREGLIRPLDAGGREDSVAYSITEKGKKELEGMQQAWLQRGTEGHAMIGLVGELFPPQHYVSFYAGHFPVELELFAQKVVQLPEPEREEALRQVEQVLQRQLDWIREQREQK